MTTLLEAAQKAPTHWCVELERMKKGRELAQKLTPQRMEQFADAADLSWEVQGTGTSHYSVKIALRKEAFFIRVKAFCPCPDFVQNGMHETPQRPCKHLLAAFASTKIPEGFPVVPDDGNIVLEKAPVDADQNWPARIGDAIGKAIQRLADQLWDAIQAGEVPLLIGPTGCGKTSAARLVATDRMRGMLVEHAGADSWTDSDLVGFVHANGQRFPGPVATACDQATLTDTPVLLFLDEFTRYNRRVQDGLMSFLLPIQPTIARAMGYDTDCPIRRAAAPFWGDTWAETERLKVVLACNPWGTELDPALVRRTTPVTVGFDAGVAALLGSKLQAAVTASWRATEDGSLPLPIEYQALAATKGPQDLSLVAGYVRRLKVLDPGAAEGYVAMLGGMGIKQEELK